MFSLYTFARQGVSTHAPAKGATRSHYLSNVQSAVSTHAPAKGATADKGYSGNLIKVSTHAPAKGATSGERETTCNMTLFQHTLPRRERQLLGVQA